MLLFMLMSTGIFAVEPEKSPLTEVQWVIDFPGRTASDKGVLAVDNKGNTYVGFNYSGYNLVIPQLNAKLPTGHHVARALVKINKTGTIEWVRAMPSEFDSRFQEMTIAPNGDVVFAGFADGQSTYPSPGDTLRIGLNKPKQPYQLHRNQYVYVARYTPAGKRVFARQFQSAWCSVGGVAVNSHNEVYLSFSHRGSLKDGTTELAPYPKDKEEDQHLVKFSPDGNRYEFLDPMLWRTVSRTPGIRFDSEDNLIAFGYFKKYAAFSETDTVGNMPYYDGNDSYVAKYSTEMNYLWSRLIYGRAGQDIKDLKIDDQNRIWVTGEYDWECILSEKVGISIASEYEYKSGTSLFLYRFKPNGTTDFTSYKASPGYNSYIVSNALAVDNKGYAYVGGYFTNDLTFGTDRVVSGRDYPAFEFTSIWAGDSVVSHQMDMGIEKCWTNLQNLDVGGGMMVYATMNYGKNYVESSSGKKWKVGMKHEDRSTVVVGSSIPDLKEINPEADSQAIQDLLASLEDIESCLSPKFASDPHVWYPVHIQADSIIPEIDPEAKPGCGVRLKKSEVILFPNPTTHKTSLALNGFTGAVNITMLSQKGDLLLSQLIKLKEADELIELDVSHLAGGMYYIIVTQNGFQKTMKLVVER